MKRILISATTLALAAAIPAMAQNEPAAPANQGMPMHGPGTPMQGQEMPMHGQEMPMHEPGMTPPAEAAMPGQMMKAEEHRMMPASAEAQVDWSKFDTGGKGYLNALDFGNWLMARQGTDMAADVERTKTSKRANLSAVKVLNATGSDFLKADKNGDRQITPDELAAYIAR